MKIPRLMKVLMSLLICIVLIRAAIGTGPVSLTDILVELQEFSFDFQETADLISLISSGSLMDGIVEWNSNLNGIDGFFKNVGNILVSYTKVIFSYLTTIVKVLWSVVVEFISLFAQILSFVTNILGFDFDVSVVGGHRGGR